MYDCICNEMSRIGKTVESEKGLVVPRSWGSRNEQQRLKGVSDELRQWGWSHRPVHTKTHSVRHIHGNVLTCMILSLKKEK